MTLALAVWIGGIVFFAFVVAPVAFGQLEPWLAGRIVRGSLLRLHEIGIVCGVVFLGLLPLAAGPSARRRWPQAGLVAAMLLLTGISQFGVIPRMDRLRARMDAAGGAAVNTPARARFDRLHRWSVDLEASVLVLGLILIYFHATSAALPAASAESLLP